MDNDLANNTANTVDKTIIWYITLKFILPAATFILLKVVVKMREYCNREATLQQIEEVETTRPIVTAKENITGVLHDVENV